MASLDCSTIRLVWRERSGTDAVTRIVHDGPSSPTHPSPIIWGRVREGVRDQRAEPGGLTPFPASARGVCPGPDGDRRKKKGASPQ